MSDVSPQTRTKIYSEVTDIPPIYMTNILRASVVFYSINQKTRKYFNLIPVSDALLFKFLYIYVEYFGIRIRSCFGLHIGTELNDICLIPSGSLCSLDPNSHIVTRFNHNTYTSTAHHCSCMYFVHTSQHGGVMAKMIWRDGTCHFKV